MKMKLLSKNKKYISLIVFFIVIIAIFAFFQLNNNNVTFSEPNWNCKWEGHIYKCSINFFVTNKTTEYKIFNVIISAYKTRVIGTRERMADQGSGGFDANWLLSMAGENLRHL